MRNSLLLIGAMLVQAIPPALPKVSAAEFTLTDVIDNVRRNERLYQDIEVVMDTTYDIGDREPVNEQTVVREQLRTRFVSQENWFRLEREGGGQDSLRTASRDRIRSFDGEQTRVLEQNAVGNISEERLEDQDFIRPHLLLFRHLHITVPFSVYLSGHEARQAHPNGHWKGGRTMEVSYEGEEEINGLKCHKVLVEVWHSGQSRNGRQIWLAEERNYLPVKVDSYTYRFSKDVPVGSGVVHELREIAPGVWFPFDIEYTVYNKFKIHQEGRQELQWRERYIVELAELDPQYDREFFSNVEFPDGTAMYIVENGEIKRSWRQGAPEAPGGPTATNKSISWQWWLIGANAAVIATLGVVLFVRKALTARRRST